MAKFRIVAYTDELILPFPSNTEIHRHIGDYEKRKEELEKLTEGQRALWEDTLLFLAKDRQGYNKGFSIEQIHQHLTHVGHGIHADIKLTTLKDALNNYINLGAVHYNPSLKTYSLTDNGYEKAVSLAFKYPDIVRWKKEPIF